MPYRESSPDAIGEFQKILIDRGILTFVRYSRGRDVMAACGQLASRRPEAARADAKRSFVR